MPAFLIAVVRGGRLAPNLFGDFLDQSDFCPLFFFGELVANFAAGKAALRGKAQILKGERTLMPLRCGPLPFPCLQGLAVWR